ncbi:hypothetical protein [Parerythrobacter jejuensis]|uniref:Uncharacterized protein n=1 Tax=Parerythrobacter jejuensis TaxID=795812 RepID=A0A845AMK8_9SPHN|nr:hypothetical protein [Parerythrobacter jejuensis]MXP31500.1 hypothetical protein [Parerythrobacter jejuensis]
MAVQHPNGPGGHADASTSRDACLLHFVGFRDDRYWNAVRVFGLPDMIHRNWDVYAAQDVAPWDIVVHADGSWDRPPRSFSTEAELSRRSRRRMNS